jgi:hypothetical protein
VRGDEQRDASGEKNSTERHGQKDRPPKSVLSFLAGLKTRDARTGLGIYESCIGPALNSDFELGLLIHSRARAYLWVSTGPGSMCLVTRDALFRGDIASNVFSILAG